MHIGFITSHFPFSDAKSVGGIGTSIKNLSLELVRTGHRVSVFVYAQETESETWEDGIKIYRFQHIKYPFFSWWFIRKNIQKKLNKIIKQTDVDILEAPDWTGITAFMNLKAPVVIRFHGSDAYFCRLEKRRQKPKNFFLELLAVRNARAYIAPTDFAGQTSSAIFGIQHKTVRTIHHGLLLSQFNNDTPEIYEYGLVVYVGAIIRKKGVLELPGIFKQIIERIPEARLLLIGSDSFDIATGSKSTWDLMCQTMDDQTAKKVSFLGNIPYRMVQDYMKKAHVCVFPTFAETLGMVTIEAMALQKPVVSSSFGWSKELIIDSESGFLCEPQDHNRYADKIISIMQDTKLCTSIGKAARERVEIRFNIEKTAKENIAFYLQVINKEI